MTLFKTPSKWYHTFARVLLFYIGSIIIFAFISGVTKGVHGVNQVSLLATLLLTFLLVLLFCRWEKLSLENIGLIPHTNSFLRFSAGFIIGIVMVVLQALLTATFAAVKFNLTSQIQPIDFLGSFALYFLVAGREELVFRSYPLRSLSYATNPVIALITITIVFILEHVLAGVSWKMSLVGSGFGGILFGIAALKTKGLALPLGLHFAWNLTQWALGFKDDTGIWREVVAKGQESNAENVALLGFSCVMSITILGIFLFYRTNKIKSVNP